MPDSLIRFPLATCLIVAFDLVDEDPDAFNAYSQRAWGVVQDVALIAADISDGMTRDLFVRTQRVVASAHIACL